MKTKIIIFLLTISLFSCVSSKKFKTLNGKYTELNSSFVYLQKELRGCSGEKNDLKFTNAKLSDDIIGLNKQIDYLKENNNQTLKQLQQLSVISTQQAESIKKSLDNIGGKDNYIQTLQQQMARKDSINLTLVMNLKGVIGNLNDTDINIKVEGSVVYIDISDKLLFKTGKYSVTEEAKDVLGKVALVLKNQPNVDFMVEGHTDNIQYNNGMLMDNWDLSVKRATSVVRILQYQYGLNPANMIAAGRSEYKPLLPNISDENRGVNRRTRIIILPQLDQFFKLLEPQKIKI